MITLAANGTLAGGADVASKLTLTIVGGMTLNAGVETYGPLYQGQLGNSMATIYTAPSTGPAFIRSMTVVNTDTAPHTFQLALGGTTAPYFITPVITLNAGAMAIYEDQLGWTILNASLASNADYASSGAFAATMLRSMCPEVNTTIATTGQVYMQAIYLQKGQVVTTLRIWSATTAAGTPTHYNAGLYDSSGNRLATGTDKTSTAWAANTLCSFTMQAAYTVPTSGLYYIALGVVATTVPTVKGGTARTDGTLSFATNIISGVSGTSYATGDMPATLALPSAKVTTSMYAEAA